MFTLSLRAPPIQMLQKRNTWCCCQKWDALRMCLVVSGCIFKGAEMEHLAASYPKAPRERCVSLRDVWIPPADQVLCLRQQTSLFSAPLHSPETYLVLHFLSMKTVKQFLLKCAIYWWNFHSCGEMGPSRLRQHLSKVLCLCVTSVLLEA